MISFAIVEPPQLRLSFGEPFVAALSFIIFFAFFLSLFFFFCFFFRHFSVLKFNVTSFYFNQKLIVRIFYIQFINVLNLINILIRFSCVNCLSWWMGLFSSEFQSIMWKWKKRSMWLIDITAYEFLSEIRLPFFHVLDLSTRPGCLFKFIATFVLLTWYVP